MPVDLSGRVYVIGSVPVLHPEAQTVNEMLEGWEEWGRFLPEQTTAVSILDRLLHHATVVITDGDSYRMKDAKHRKENPKPT